MEDLGLKSEEICDILRLVAAVLKLGNTQFVPTTNMDGTEGCCIANEYGGSSWYCFLFINFPPLRLKSPTTLGLQTVTMYSDFLLNHGLKTNS